MIHFLRHSISGLLMFLLLFSHANPALAHDPAEEMAVAAERFLNSLDEAQRKQTVYKMSDAVRKNWHFFPDKFLKPDGIRYGLPINQMGPDQRVLVHALLNAGLSHKGYLTAMTIISLEKVLHELEQQNPIRDPELYYVTIFGEPGDPHAWGWRFEGHHLSLNFAIIQGRLISVAPAFFGANPAIVKEGPQADLWTLKEEEQLARKLVLSLSNEQRELAVLSDTAPDDIITGAQRQVDKGQFTPAEGISSDELNESQRATLLQLIEVYAKKFRPEIVNQIDEREKLFDLTDVHFAWAGGTEGGEGHYYRVQTPQFLFEYDNTQNNANHAHSVWRDFDGDFGEDLLRKHYDDSHAGESRTLDR